MGRDASPAALVVLLLGVWLVVLGGLALGAEAKGPLVDLDHSFQIPQGDGHSLSHTPALVFTRDGKRMVTATADKELVVFDAASRKLLHRHRLDEKATDAVSLDRGGRVAAWVLQGGGLVVLDIETGKVLAKDEKAGAKWIAVAPAGERLAISRGATLEIRLVEDLSVQRTLNGHKAQVTNLAWSHDGKLLAATAQDGTFLVLDAASGKTVYETKKPGALYALDFHPANGTVAFGGHERKVYQVDLKTKKEQVLSGSQPYWITCLAYSPDGSMIALGDESCDVWLYEVAKPGKHLFHSKHHVECWLSQVAWAPDNETFLFGCRPNSHAGKPALYTPLVQAEAARRAEVRQSRRAVLDAIEGELKAATDDKARKALEGLRTALNNEEKLGGHGLGVGGGFAIGIAEPAIPVPPNVGIGPIALPAPKVPVGGQAGGVDPKLLPKNLQALLETHQTNQRKAQEELKRDFCINQWRVRRE